MIEINLLPDVKRDLLKAQRLRNLVTFFSVVAGAGMLGLVIMAFIITQGQQIFMSLKTNEIKTKFSEMSKIQDGTTAATLKNQLNAIQKIRNASPDTSRILGQIVPAITTKKENEVTLSSVTYDPETRLMTVEGKTAKGFSALDGFMKTIAGTQIIYKDTAEGADENKCSESVVNDDEKACLLADEGTVTRMESSQGQNEDGTIVLRFTVTFNLNADALKFTSKDLKIKILGEKDVTDSTIQIPDGVFQEDTSKKEDK